MRICVLGRVFPFVIIAVCSALFAGATWAAEPAASPLRVTLPDVTVSGEHSDRFYFGYEGNAGVYTPSAGYSFFNMLGNTIAFDPTMMTFQAPPTVVLGWKDGNPDVWTTGDIGLALQMLDSNYRGGGRLSATLGDRFGLPTASGEEVTYHGASIKVGKATVESELTYPLVFKAVANEGVVYLCGRGTIVLPDGNRMRFGEGDTVDTWLPRAGSTDQLTREAAAQALGRLARTTEERSRATRVLISMLADQATEVKRNAAEALGRIADPAAKEALSHLKGGASGVVGAVAEESLGLVELAEAKVLLTDNDARAPEAIARCLKHKWATVRYQTAEFLQQHGDSAVVGALTEAAATERVVSVKQAMQEAAKRLSGSEKPPT